MMAAGCGRSRSGGALPAKAGAVALLGVLLAYVVLPFMHGLSPHHHHEGCSHGPVAAVAEAATASGVRPGPVPTVDAPEREHLGACVLCLAKRIGSEQTDTKDRSVRVVAASPTGVLARPDRHHARTPASGGAGGPRAPPPRASL